MLSKLLLANLAKRLLCLELLPEKSSVLCGGLGEQVEGVVHLLRPVAPLLLGGRAGVEEGVGGGLGEGVGVGRGGGQEESGVA